MARGNRTNHVMEPAHEASTTHGTYKLKALAVAEWPKELRERFDKRCTEIYRQVHIDPEKHRAAVEQCARIETVVEAVYNYLMAHGVFTEGGEPPAVLGKLAGWENSLNRSLMALGLTTSSTHRNRPIKGKTVTDIFAETGNDDEDGQG